MPWHSDDKAYKEKRLYGINFYYLFKDVIKGEFQIIKDSTNLAIIILTQI